MNKTQEIQRAKETIAQYLGLGDDYNLQTLVNKLICEVQDSKSLPPALVDALALQAEEDPVERTKTLSNHAALNQAIADMLDVPANRTDDAVKKVLHYMSITSKALNETMDYVEKVVKFVGKRKDEDLFEAVRRAVLEAEVQPGAAKTLAKIKKAYGVQSDEEVVEIALGKRDFTVTVIVDKKGKAVGAKLRATGPTPIIGETELEMEER